MTSMYPIPRTEELIGASIDAYDDAKANFHLDGGTEALFIAKPYYAILAFRGTTFDFEDILRDIRATPCYSKTLRSWCHKGFLKAAETAWESPLRDGLMRRGLPVHLTGHSLGGAISTLVGGFVLAAGKPPASLTTFGCPAPSYGCALSDILRSVPGARYVNGADCVPSHPWLGSHTHPATKIGPEWTISRRLSDGRYLDHRAAEYRYSLGHYRPVAPRERSIRSPVFCLDGLRHLAFKGHLRDLAR